VISQGNKKGPADWLSPHDGRSSWRQVPRQFVAPTSFYPIRMCLVGCLLPQAESVPQGRKRMIDSRIAIDRRRSTKATGVQTVRRRASKKSTGAAMQDILDHEPKTTPKPEHQEGPVARAIEQQTAKLPSDIFLWAAVGSISASLVMMLMGDEKKANFVGHWAPTFLILGMYNKMVKLHGSDSTSNRAKIITS
jgi:hypothetical protein